MPVITALYAGILGLISIFVAFQAGSYVAAANANQTDAAQFGAVGASLDGLLRVLTDEVGERAQSTDQSTTEDEKSAMEFDEIAAHDLVFAENQSDNQQAHNELDDEFDDGLLEQLSTSLGSAKLRLA